VINISLGGTLFEDIQEQRPNSLNHQCFPEQPREHLAHSVAIKPNSQLSAILESSTTMVNSMHHQGIDSLAPDLQASAHAPDGLIEAVEILYHPFGLAVQWHPEHLQANATMQTLFHAFVKACTSGKRRE
jgi:putative glutamine amidotransferase